MAEEQYTISQYDKALHNRGAFTCGVSEIDSWQKKSITRLIKENRIIVWCANNADGELVGFYSLCVHSVQPQNAPTLAHTGERNEIPAVYLPVIATAKNHQGKGIGAVLMAHAIQNAIDISDKAGTATIILDVLEDKHFEKRMRFYKKIGFNLIGYDHKRLYLSIKDAKASV